MKIKITSDSTCDLSQELVLRYDLAILPLAVAMGGTDYHDGVDITPDTIYRHVDAGGELPQTAAINLTQYQEFWKPFASTYDAVIHLNISSEFSSCYQNACLAAESFDNVFVVDSRNLSTGHGLLVLKAAELANSGMEASQIAQVLRETTGKVHASFVPDCLDYLKKGGRCSSVAALGANLLKLKPCIEVKDGKMLVSKKYRGSMEKVLREYVADHLASQEDLDLSRIFVTHSGMDEAQVQAIVEQVKSLHPFQEVLVTVAGCTVSSHCGPGTLGVLFMTK